jgi:hypothetical protein
MIFGHQPFEKVFDDSLDPSFPKPVPAGSKRGAGIQEIKEKLDSCFRRSDGILRVTI